MAYSYNALRHVLHKKFIKNVWFFDALFYLKRRYPPIDERFFNTLRYIDLCRENISTFSYEYASILRDIGSVFASTLDILVRKSSGIDKKTDYGDYIKFLDDNINGIADVGVELNYPIVNTLIFPFREISPSKSMSWWKAYNNVKHQDFSKSKDGSLGNVLKGLASLAILYSASDGKHGPQSRIFSKIGYFSSNLEPAILFFKDQRKEK